MAKTIRYNADIRNDSDFDNRVRKVERKINSRRERRVNRSTKFALVSEDFDA